MNHDDLHDFKRTLSRFRLRMRAADRGCVIWTGAATASGYGAFNVKLRGGSWRLIQAHRFAWLALHGTLPGPGQQLVHTCPNRLCVNPAHLKVRTILTPADIRAIRGSEESDAELARRYGITEGYAYQLRKGYAR